MKSKPDMTVGDWDEFYGTDPDLSARALIYEHKVLPHVLGEPHTILDVGCATGDGLLAMRQVFPKALLWGVDFSGEAILACRRRIPLSSMFRQYDITQEALHFRADLVMCVQTLEHFPYFQVPWVVSKLFQSTLKQLLISVPYANKIPDKDHKTQFNERSFGAMSPDTVSVDGPHMTFGWIRR